MHSCPILVLWAWLLLPYQLLACGFQLLCLGNWWRTQRPTLRAQKFCEDSLGGMHKAISLPESQLPNLENQKFA